MGLSPRRSMASGLLSHSNTLFLAASGPLDQVPREAGNALSDAPSQTSVAGKSPLANTLTRDSTFCLDKGTLSRHVDAIAAQDGLGLSVSQRLPTPRGSTVLASSVGGTLPRGTMGRRPSQPGSSTLSRDTRKSGTGRKSQWKAPLTFQADGPRVQAGQWLSLYVHTGDAAGNACTAGGFGHMFTCHSVHQSMQTTALDHQFRC